MSFYNFFLVRFLKQPACKEQLNIILKYVNSKIHRRLTENVILYLKKYDSQI